jgi:anti-anti-sigma factor
MPAVVSPTGVDQAEKEIGAAVAEGGKEFVLDMEKVGNLYSSGVRLINFLYKAATKAGAKLYIVNITENVEHILHSVNLDKIIPIFRTMIDFEIGKDGVDLDDS